MSDFALTSKGVVKYSPGEQRIFRLLPKDGRPRTSAIITKLFYGMALDEVPIHGRKIVIGLLSSLMKKSDINSETFCVRKTRRSGPIPMSFWIEPRVSASEARKRKAA